MYQPLIKFHPHPAIITQVLRIFALYSITRQLLFMALTVGDKAPDFLGLDENGAGVRLSDFKGRKVVLYFYPKDNTSGCTAEACSMRDNYDELRGKGFEVIGVSADSAASHRKFIEKQSLPFALIADTEHKLAEAFGTWGEKKMCGRSYMGMLRTTFIIGADGIIEKVYSPKEIKTKEHAQQILK